MEFPLEYFFEIISTNGSLLFLGDLLMMETISSRLLYVCSKFSQLNTK